MSTNHMRAAVNKGMTQLIERDVTRKTVVARVARALLNSAGE